MFPDSPYAHPVGSFPVPVPVVDVDPDVEPLVKICVNAEWIPYIAGALKQLLLQSTWRTNDPAVLALQQERVFNLFYQIGRAGACNGEPVPTYEEFVDMVAFRQDCDCNTFVKCCDGSEKELAYKSDLPGASNPGNGAPQPAPGGGQQTYCQRLNANGQMNLPTLVNTGDTIEVTSANGSWWDGGEQSFGFPIWRCPDGEQYVAGICQGASTETITGTDPVVGAAHMSLIVYIGSNAYSLSSGVFTVPSGVSNGIAVIQVNDTAIANNQGSADVCVKYTNNQAAPVTEWCHIWGGLYPQGSWVTARGSESGGIWIDSDDPSTPQVGIYIDAGAVFHLKGIDVTYTVDDTDARTSAWYKDALITQYDHVDGLPTGTNVHSVKNIDDPAAQVVGIIFSANATHEINVINIAIRGVGTDPFAGLPTCPA